MNWIDFVLIALLLTALVVGAKKGLVRELSAFVIFFAAIILTITYIDSFAVWVYDKIGGSPMVSAFISFLFLLAFSYGLFKLAGYIFYKVASIKSQGKPDQVGGAIGGLVRGWAPTGGGAPPPRETATFQVSTKPGINLIWLGTLMILAGGTLATRRRARESARLGEPLKGRMGEWESGRAGERVKG